MRKREDIVSDAQKCVGYRSNADRLMLLFLEVLLDIRDKI